MALADRHWVVHMQFTESDATTYTLDPDFWVLGADAAARQAAAESKALDQTKNMRTAPRKCEILSSVEIGTR